MEIVISQESKQRLIRYANAVREYELTHRKIYYRDGYADLGPSAASVTERAAAKADLVNCPEPEIKDLVYQTQIERVDEAMSDESKTELDVVRASQDALVAQNELIYLGHKFKAEQAAVEPKITGRRRRDGRPSRSRTNRRRRS
jgi:hypothetical protein